jgi:PPOX class probable F420-dependent enzyme
MPDGSPQTTPVWVDLVDGKVLVNTAVGRQKDKNVRRDPRVAVTLQDPQNPYRYLEIRGKVDEITTEGATQHIDKMAKKYIGQDKYPWARPGEQRVLIKITPEKFHTMG